jgi:hypothetical protein
MIDEVDKDEVVLVLKGLNLLFKVSSKPSSSKDEERNFVERLVDIFQTSLVAVDALNVKTVEFQPAILESAHNYPDNMNDYHELSYTIPEDIPDPESYHFLKIWFDEDSISEETHDYVRFYKSQSRSDPVGEKYSGSGENAYPYLDNPLVVPCTINEDNKISVWVEMHSDSSTNVS